MIWLWIVIAWNLVITCWDAYAAGVLWGISGKSKIGKFLSICVFGVALVGFYYTFILVGVAVGILGTAFLLGINVFLGLPTILFGIVITIVTWVEAIDKRSIGDTLVAVYNTFAVVHDSHVWVDSLKWLSEAGGLSSMAEGIGGDDDEGNAVIAILFLIVALLITTVVVLGLFEIGMKRVETMGPRRSEQAKIPRKTMGVLWDASWDLEDQAEDQAASELGHKLADLNEQLGRGALTKEDYGQKKKQLEGLTDLKLQLGRGDITFEEYHQRKKKLLEKSKA